MDPSLRRLADEFDVREVLTRYCRAVDRSDLELMKSTYWPDATDDHIIFVGNGHEFCDFILPVASESMEMSQHAIGNVWLHFDGDVARCETYIQGFFRMRDEAMSNVIVAGRYLDRLERRNGEWRIAARKFVLDWEEKGGLAFGEEAVRKSLSIDTRHRDEDSYRLFAGKLLG